MSVPFKYRQHIRDLHESFHDGKPITEEELMYVIDIICPVEQQAFTEQYRAQCPLNTNSFLALMYELQKTTKIPYEEIVWRYIRGALKNGLFNGGDSMDLKALRTTLDPMMRSVRYDVQNVYKEHAIPDGEGRITIDQLCDVFRAMYPANQIVYIEMYKWARAKKVEKRRGSIMERGKAFGGVVPDAVSTPSVASSRTQTAAVEVTATATAPPSEAQKAPFGEIESATAPLTPLATLEASSTGELKGGVDVPQDVPPVPENEAVQKQFEIQKEQNPSDLSKEGITNAPRSIDVSHDTAGTASLMSVLHVTNTDGDAKAEATKAAAEGQEHEIQPLRVAITEKSDEDDVAPPMAQTVTPNATLTHVFSDEQERPRGTHSTSQYAESLKEEEEGESSTLFVSPPIAARTGAIPKEVQLERRSGLDFNPPHIRDMEPPIKRDAVVESREPMLRLRAREEEPSWEYEEALLDAVLTRVVPSQPVDPLVPEFLKELARQEEELQAALQVEMENLTSNMLACEILEGRMMVLRDQKRAKCFDRLEGRRLELLAAMERHTRDVSVLVAQNKELLGGDGAVAQSNLKGVSCGSGSGGSRAQPKPRPVKGVSVSTQPPPLLSTEHQRQATQRDHRLEAKLQQLHSVVPTPTGPKRPLPTRESRPHTSHALFPSADAGLVKHAGVGCCPPTIAVRGDNWGDALMPQPSVPVVHSRRAQDSRGVTSVPVSAAISGVQHPSPTPKRPARRGVNPYLTAEIAAGLLTSSQVQHRIEERLAAYLATPSCDPRFL